MNEKLHLIKRNEGSSIKTADGMELLKQNYNLKNSKLFRL
jgi:hypothetical protein